MKMMNIKETWILLKVNLEDRDLLLCPSIKINILGIFFLCANFGHKAWDYITYDMVRYRSYDYIPRWGHVDEIKRIP